MLSGWFTKGAYHNENHDINLLTDDIKVMLVNSSFVADRINMEFVSSADAYELSGAGYSGGFGGSGRIILSGKQLTADSNGIVHLIADPVNWPLINAGTINSFLIIKENTSDNDSYLLLTLTTDILTNLPLLTQGSAVSLSFGSGGIALFDPITGGSGQFVLTANSFSTIGNSSVSTLYQPLTANSFSTVGSASSP